MPKNKAGIQKPRPMVMRPVPGDQPRVTLANGKEMDAVDLTSFRRGIGGFFDNALHGREFAIIRKGQVVAVVSPPPTRKATAEELQEILDETSDTSILR